MGSTLKILFIVIFAPGDSVKCQLEPDYVIKMRSAEEFKDMGIYPGTKT